MLSGQSLRRQQHSAAHPRRRLSRTKKDSEAEWEEKSIRYTVDKQRSPLCSRKTAAMRRIKGTKTIFNLWFGNQSTILSHTQATCTRAPRLKARKEENRNKTDNFPHERHTHVSLLLRENKSRNTRRMGKKRVNEWISKCR